MRELKDTYSNFIIGLVIPVSLVRESSSLFSLEETIAQLVEQVYMYLENIDPSSNGRTPVSKTVIPSEGVVLVRVQAGLPTRNRKPKTHPAILLEITYFWLLFINNASCKLKLRGSLLGAKPLQI